MIIAAGTIVSSLQSDRLTKKLGDGKSDGFQRAADGGGFVWFFRQPQLPCALPVGGALRSGAGSVDASLNNYVALHYASRHMSWLHCMWGVGASLGPYVMGYALTGGQGWNMGYRYIALMQIVLTAILLFSLPLWKKQTADEAGRLAKTVQRRCLWGRF